MRRLMSYLLLTALLLVSSLLISCQRDSPNSPLPSSRFHSPTPSNNGDLIESGLLLTWEYDSDDIASTMFEVRIWDENGSVSCDTVYGATSLRIPDPTDLGEEMHSWEVTAWWRNRMQARSPLWRFHIGRWYRYPLALNTGWRYKVKFYYTDVEPVTYAPEFRDTFEYVTYVHVKRLDTLPENNKPAYKLAESIHYSEGQPSTDTSFGWFNNERDGLYNYAYEVGSFGLSLPRKLVPRGEWKIDPAYASYFAGSPLLTPGAAASSDQYIFDPVKSLAYPLRRGSEWELTRLGDQITITKKVLGRSHVKIESGNYFCWTICWYCDGGMPGPLSNISVIDQIGAPGLVSRKTSVSNVRLTNYEYAEGYATATVHQDIELDYMFRVDSIDFFPGGVIIVEE